MNCKNVDIQTNTPHASFLSLMELSDYVPHRLALIYGICICLALWIATSNFNPVWIGLVQTPDKSIFSQYHSIKNCGFVPLNQTGSAFTFEIPIDHFNSTDNRNFQNRYWINDTYYQDGGPVFLFDTGRCLDFTHLSIYNNTDRTLSFPPGEHGISDFMVSIFLEEAIGNSAIMALARKYNGLAILWEHRFYGMSLPFKLDEDTGMALDGYEAYRFLTTEQVCCSTAISPYQLVDFALGPLIELGIRRYSLFCEQFSPAYSLQRIVCFFTNGNAMGFCWWKLSWLVL